jgi:hypothetical protein
MKSAEEILNQWHKPLHISEIQKICLIEAIKEYAKQAIEVQLQIAAEEANTIQDEGYRYGIVDKYSIINCNRIELL